MGLPKVWRFNRVYPLLDGLLRDVESISLAEVRDLDPNKVHSVSFDFVQSLFALGVRYDQATALKNKLAIQRLESEQQGVIEEMRLHREYLTQLRQQRSTLSGQLQEAMRLQLEAQKTIASAQSEEDKAVAQREYEAHSQLVTTLRGQIETVNKQLEDAEKTKPTQFEVQTTGAAAPDLKDLTTTTNELQTFWNRLPDSIKNQLGSEIGKPGLPATKQMDNFLTLLRERLARLLAVVNDDVSRAERDVFLMQFDVGVFPGSKAKHEVARVEYSLTATCEGGMRAGSDPNVYAYELYPGQSSYNISQFYGKTRTTGLVANVLTLFGLGVGAEYKRQREQLRSSLVQSVYVSGFGAGSSAFGWYFAPGPFELRVSPGIRTTYAAVVTPKCVAVNGKEGSQPKLKLDVKASTQWLKREESEMKDPPNQKTLGSVELPALTRGIQVEQVDYVPSRFTVGEDGQDAGVLDTTVQILLREEIDPNLVVTVNGKPFRRVRDWRGRATEPGAGGNEVIVGEENEAKKTKRVPVGRGLIEANNLEPDTWFAVNPRLLLLKIAKVTAGTHTFPVIRLGDASGRGGELLSLIRSSAEPVYVRVDEWEFDGSLVGYYPHSTFLPLFISEEGYLEDFAPGEFSAAVDRRIVGASGRVSKLELRVTPRFPPAARNPGQAIRRMRGEAQVVLADTASREHAAHWPLWCDESVGKGNFLICTVEEQVISSVCKARSQDCSHGLEEAKLEGWLENLSVWVDQVPYHEIAGLWGSATIKLRDEWFTFGDATYRIAPNEKQGVFESWTATIVSQWLKPEDKVEELEKLGIKSEVPINRKFLEITIPKTKLADLPAGTMILKRKLDGRWEAVAELPELGPHLLPKNLRISGQRGDCTIVGDRLEAVDMVILRSPDISNIERKGNQLIVGAGQLRFSLPKNMPDRTYDLKLAIGTARINAVDSNGQQLKLEAGTCGAQQSPQ